MSSEWTQLTIGDLVRSGEAAVQTGPFGSQLHKHDYVATGVPVIPTEAIGRGRILDIGVPQISQSKADELNRHRLKAGDILFARRGAQATGLSAIVDDRYVDAICGTGALLLRVESPRVDAHYLSLFLSSAFAFDWLRTHAVGAVMPNLNTDIIKALPFTLPSIREQKELATFFGALDDRITLLRETNATLEPIAQALFKSWFVDFDPVRAKAEGREPEGLDPDTAALFPDSMTEWAQYCRRVRASELLDCKILMLGDGYRAKNSELGSPGIAFVRAGDLLQGRITPTEDTLSMSALAKAHNKMANAGDTAFTSKGTIGRFAYVDESAGEAVYSPQVCFWRSLDREQLQPVFLHFWMKSPLFSAQVDLVRGQAAIMDFVSLSDQRRMFIDLPSPPIQQRFSEHVQPILNRISVNRATASILGDLRDTLLPRLLSGQLRLPKAETMLKDAA